MKITLHTVGLSLLLSCAAFAGPRPQYQVTVLVTESSDPGEVPYYEVAAMNDRRDIVGITNDYSPALAAIDGHGLVETHPFLITEKAGHGVAHVFTNLYGGLYAINDSGEALGFKVLPDAPWDQAYVFRPENPAAVIRLLPAQFEDFACINNAGTIAGELILNSQTSGQGFIYKNGLITTFGPVGVGVSCINNRDQVVGNYGYNPVTGVTRAYLYSGGKFTDLVTPPGAAGVSADKINDRGEILGTISYLASTQIIGGITYRTWISHLALYINGKFTDIGLPPGNGVVAGQTAGFNNSGTVIGNSTVNTLITFEQDPWIYSNGKYQLIKDVIPSGWTINNALAINDRGQILVQGEPAATAATTNTYLLLLTPIPERGFRPPMNDYGFKSP